MGDVRYKGYTREMALDSVGKGWAPLVHRVFDTLENIKGSVRIIQVKEKFAGLRIYTDYIHTELQGVINNVEMESFKLCETCGSPGKVRGKGTIYTSCDTHAKNNDAPHDYQPGNPMTENEDA